MKSKPLKILLACGGSGGHLIPGLVVREELVRRGHTVLLSVSDKPIDKNILAENHLKADLVLKANISGMPALLRTLRAIWDLVTCTIKSRSFMKVRGVDFVLGMGGFNCASPLLAARWLNLPCALHESNVIPGKVTRILHKCLDALFVGFEQCRRHLPDAKNLHFTGNPTRYKRYDTEKRRTAKDYHVHGLQPEKKTVLLLGGSQGSEFLNTLLQNSAPLFAQHRDNIQFIHISGRPQSPLEIHPLDDLGVTRKHYQFYNKMHELYAVADVVVARSGSGVISEILELQKKAVLIPLPTSADNHQFHNAKAVEKTGIIEVLEQKEASPARLAEKIFRLLKSDGTPSAKNPTAQKKRPEEIIAEELEKVAPSKRKSS